MAIGPIRLLALPSYRSLTNQILIFAILDLNFSLNFDCMQTAFSPCLLYYYVCADVVHFTYTSAVVVVIFELFIYFSGLTAAYHFANRERKPNCFLQISDMKEVNEIWCMVGT